MPRRASGRPRCARAASAKRRRHNACKPAVATERERARCVQSPVLCGKLDSVRLDALDGRAHPPGENPIKVLWRRLRGGISGRVGVAGSKRERRPSSSTCSFSNRDMLDERCNCVMQDSGQVVGGEPFSNSACRAGRRQVTSTRTYHPVRHDLKGLSEEFHRCRGTGASGSAWLVAARCSKDRAGAEPRPIAPRVAARVRSAPDR